MLASNNKILARGNKVLMPFVIPPLDFRVRSTTYPTGVASVLRFDSKITNQTIYIDYGDGSPIVSYTAVNNRQIDVRSRLGVHTYTDGVEEHIVKIWFKYPSKMTGIYHHLNTIYGDLTTAISYYNLDLLHLGTPRYLNDAGNTFPPGYYRTVSLTSLTDNVIPHMPEWLFKSRILSLTLNGKMDLSNMQTSKLLRLIEIIDLTYLVITNVNLKDMPPNLKDITTFKGLLIGKEDVPITPNINACKTMEEIAWGYKSGGNISLTNGGALISSWGVGVGGMNLKQLFVNGCHFLPASLPLGLEDCPTLKEIDYRSTFLTEERVDEFILEAYNRVIVGGSMIGGNTILRNMRIWLGTRYAAVGLSARPSGVYQAPIGYIQGSNNGTPASGLERLYVLVKQYGWKVQIAVTTGETTNEELT